MLETLKRALRSTTGDGDSPKPADREDELRLATCALLIETAMADDDLSEEEFDKVVLVMRERFHLDDGAIHALIETAREEHRKAMDVWSFANQINETLTRGQKIEVMEMIWRVVYADGTMDKFEDYMTKKLHRLLRIDHATFIAAKLKVKNEVENSTQND